MHKGRVLGDLKLIESVFGLASRHMKDFRVATRATSRSHFIFLFASQRGTAQRRDAPANSRIWIGFVLLL